MELTRKQVIEELQKMLEYYSIRQDSTSERKQALEYAISSLKTDEAYQIMYEGGEIFTKDDMVAMLTEIQLEIEELKSYESADGQDLAMLADIGILFKQKINALKGEA